MKHLNAIVGVIVLLSVSLVSFNVGRSDDRNTVRSSDQALTELVMDLDKQFKDSVAKLGRDHPATREAQDKLQFAIRMRISTGLPDDVLLRKVADSMTEAELRVMVTGLLQRVTRLEAQAEQLNSPKFEFVR